MVGVFTSRQILNANHMSSIDLNGFCAVASSPGYKVDMSFGYLLLVHETAHKL